MGRSILLSTYIKILDVSSDYLTWVGRNVPVAVMPVSVVIIWIVGRGDFKASIDFREVY